MGSLIAAYLVGWLAVAAYVGWLGAQNARASRRLEEIETLLRTRREPANTRSKAA
jgi:CcmD family protein